MTSKPKLQRYEVMVPYHQYLHYFLDAESPEEALRLAQRNVDREGQPLSEECSTGCGPNAKPIVRKLR